MNQTLKLLFLEDDLLDVELCVKELERAGYDVQYQVTQSREEFLRHIEQGVYDIVLADYNIPGFGGMDALREFRERGLDKPFLIISGSIGEETAVESLKAGANDYVLKDRLVRLPSAVQQALDNWQTRLSQRIAEEALVETNETLQALIQSSPLAIVAMDRTGIVQMWNNAAERMFGWKEEEVIGSPLPIVPDDVQTEVSDLRKRVLQGHRFTDIESPRVRRDGTRLQASISTAPLRAADGTINGIMAVIADITERKQAEQARLEMEKRLDEAKRLFYRETILAVTGGKLEIVDPPEISRAMEGLAISRDLDDAGKLSPVRREIREYCASLGLEEQRLGDFILGAGEAMTNALKHGGGGRVRAGTDGASIWLAVSDKGPGIDALVLPGATLQRGFSTKPSLGIGYSVILNVSDHIKLNTGPHGTTVLMQKYIHEPTLEPAIDIIPDTW